MDKIAILILGHKNPNQLSKLVSSLANSHFDFYIHIDKKVDILPFQKSLENLKDMNISFVKDRIKTYFFDFSAHPTNPVECCADANPKTMLPNDT